MKKFALILIICSMVVGMCGCYTKRLTEEQSKENYANYRQRLNEVAQEYGVELVGTTITISSSERINILLERLEAGSDKVIESFSIEYEISDIESEDEFNVQLFVDLVNSVSGRELTVEFCEEFLMAPEDEYPASDYGFEKLNGEIIAKEYPLNFFEDWVIGYELTEDGNGILRFGGETKNGTET